MHKERFQIILGIFVKLITLYAVIFQSIHLQFNALSMHLPSRHTHCTCMYTRQKEYLVQRCQHNTEIHQSQACILLQSCRWLVFSWQRWTCRYSFRQVYQSNVKSQIYCLNQQRVRWPKLNLQKRSFSKYKWVTIRCAT